jgi:serine/threonine-protein kinase
VSAAPTPLAVALSDRYRIERELGQGGMATVYLAEDLKHARQVAIKVLKPALGAVLGAERFLSEIRTTASLQHPHLLPLFDSGEANGLLYYVMPYVEGETLRARMLAQPQLPVDETVRLITAVAGALDFAHARGIVHRDLKPENILLQAEQPVIADFGIALAVAQAGTERITGTGLSLGTPHYMSPEQAAGTHTVDARSDQYALGAIAYELLSGEPPHTGPTTQAIIARVMTETPRSIRSTRPAVPAGVEAAILRALEKAPADRFTSCGTFANALASGRVDGGTLRWHMRAGLVALVAASVVVIALLKPWEGARGVATSADDERSLAVLPFTSVGGDTANSYFAAGIADELTSALSRIPGLRLAGRASAARVKQQGDGARDIGTALNVSAVLDGSVRRAGNRIRVSAELTSAADGRVLWTETYERALEDVFAVQDDITRSIVGALQVRLASGDVVGAAGARGGTSNLAAYDHYLRALELYRVRGAGLRDAERSLMAAVAADPTYAKAHALLASVLIVQTSYLEVKASDVHPRARAAAERAVALDDSLADAHTALGHANIETFAWVDAERELRRAIALDPRAAEAQFRLGELLVNIGRVREAPVYLENASRLDPLYPTAVSYRAWALVMLDRYEEGISESRLAVALGPDNTSVNSIAVVVLLQAGRLEEAAVQARGLRDMTTAPSRLGLAAWALGRAGARDEATMISRRLEAQPTGTWGSSVGRMYARLGLGDLSGALTAMENAAESEPQLLVGEAFVAVTFDPLRAEPRFAAVLRRFNLDVERLTLPDGGRSR